MEKKIIIILLLITVILGYYSYSVKQRPMLQEEIDFYQSIIDSETDWIKDLQLSNGAYAFTMKEDGLAWINPYFADRTAMALLRSGDGKEDDEGIKKYLDWHFNHLNDSKIDKNGIDGTIYEYYAEVKNGIVISETTKEEYDSVDSYAASFLNLLWDYYNYTDDAEYLIVHYDEILRVINALDATMDNGLTIAKPDHPVKYLMDNAEVYEGLGCAVGLYGKVFLPGLKKNTSEFENVKYQYEALIEMQNKLGEKIEDRMWNESDGHYTVVVQGEDEKVIWDFNWDRFYPDATSQLFPIIHGVLDENSGRAKYLYEAFGKHYKWEDFEHYTKGHADFYWGRLPYTAAVMKDEDRVKAYIIYYSQNIISEHKRPLYNADAAWVVLASEEMLDFYKGKIKWLLPVYTG